MDLPFAPTEPEVVPAFPTHEPEPETDPPSLCTIHSDSGLGMTVWSLPSAHVTPDATFEMQLQLSPDAPAIIGRKNGGEIEYLDPRYIPSPIMPGTGKTILKKGGHAEDSFVSRGHFMLRADPRGIVLVNGVPRRGGGIRPPHNGTWLLAPQQRMLAPAEEITIEHGSMVTIVLPNSTQLTISAQ